MPAKKAAKKKAAKSAKKTARAKKPAAKAAPVLKPRQEAFVEHYVANGGKNASDAARKAGVTGTRGAIEVTAHRMLRNAKVQEAIHARTRERLRGVKALADEVYYLLADHLRADFGDLSDCFVNGKFDLNKAKQSDVSRLLKKMRIREMPNGEVLTELELHDSQSAAARLAKLMGLEQQPRLNEDDTARVKAELAKLVSEGWEPDQAREIVIEADPTAARFLM